jgi:hypothetical protein
MAHCGTIPTATLDAAEMPSSNCLAASLRQSKFARMAALVSSGADAAGGSAQEDRKSTGKMNDLRMLFHMRTLQDG